jgi:hypothetical protein
LKQQAPAAETACGSFDDSDEHLVEKAKELIRPAQRAHADRQAATTVTKIFDVRLPCERCRSLAFRGTYDSHL